MQHLAEQEPHRKKPGTLTDPDEDSSVLYDRIPVTTTIAGDHPYRRRKL